MSRCGGVWVDLVDGPGDADRLEPLITALRQPALPEELEDEATIVAAMQTALGSTTRAHEKASGRRQVLGRVAVVKAGAVVGAIAFGVAAAAATSGVVEPDRLPGWPGKPPEEAPAPVPGIGSAPEAGGPDSRDGPGQRPNADPDAATETGMTPGSNVGAKPADPTPSDGSEGSTPSDSSTTSTTTTTTTTTSSPADDAVQDNPGNGDPPPVTVPPQATHPPGRPPTDGSSAGHTPPR